MDKTLARMQLQILWGLSCSVPIGRNVAIRRQLRRRAIAEITYRRSKPSGRAAITLNSLISLYSLGATLTDRARRPHDYADINPSMREIRKANGVIADEDIQATSRLMKQPLAYKHLVIYAWT
jgi:hypothetical protein